MPNDVHPPRSIKIEYQVYQDLDIMRLRRETFSQAIARLIHVAKGISQIYAGLETAQDRIYQEQVNERARRADKPAPTPAPETRSTVPVG